MRLKCILGIVIVSMLALYSHAMVQQGMIEADFMGLYANVDPDEGGNDADVFAIMGNCGYFFTDAVEGSVELRYMTVDVDDADADVGSIGIGIDYHFMTGGTFVPYIGTAGHWTMADASADGDDFDEDDFMWELHCGAKQFLNDNVAVKYEIEYDMHDDFDAILVGIGLSYFFQ